MRRKKRIKPINPIYTSDFPTEEGNGDSKDKPDGCPHKPILIPGRDEMI